MNPMHRARGTAIVGVVLSVLSAACSGDTGADTTTAAVEPSSAAAVTTSTTVAPLDVTTTAPAATTIATAPPSSTTTFVPVEATVTGVVIDVVGDLAGIDNFTIRLEDGSDLVLRLVEGLLFDETAPIGHVRDHLISGNPVLATYEVNAEGAAVATAIGDAAGGTNGHDD